jgi:uncharacterized membrane protein YkgB
MAAKAKEQSTRQASSFIKRHYVAFLRGSLFVVYFWFGFLKVIDVSPASPLAESLTEATIGMEHFRTAFLALAVIECVIGVLFLFPRATKWAVGLLIAHMIVVCSPLVLIPGQAWDSFLVPTLEGQYIIKNLVLVAASLTIAAQLQPSSHKTNKA